MSMSEAVAAEAMAMAMAQDAAALPGLMLMRALYPTHLLDAVLELELMTAVGWKGHQLVDSGRFESQLAASFLNLCGFFFGGI